MDKKVVKLEPSKDGKCYYAKGFSVVKEGLVQAIGLLLKALLKCIKTDSPFWAARIQIVLEVRDGEIVNKFANLTISQDGVFETDTTVLDRDDVRVADSSVFEAMIRKAR
jgi:hypothetical protein